MSNPLSRLEHLLRVQMPGAPSADIAGAIEDVLQIGTGGIGSAVEGVASPASDEVLTRVAAVEAAVEKLRADIAAMPAPTPAASTDEPTVTQRLDAIDRAFVALQGDISKLAAAAPTPDATDALHRRLAVLEARSVAAPARAAAPAARPAAASA